MQLHLMLIIEQFHNNEQELSSLNELNNPTLESPYKKVKVITKPYQMSVRSNETQA